MTETRLSTFPGPMCSVVAECRKRIPVLTGIMITENSAVLTKSA